MMWAKRLLVGSGMAMASLLVVPGVAGAANNCVVPQTMNEPSCVVVPSVQGNTTAPAHTVPLDGTAGGGSAAPTSLPFTGADFEELAAVGIGAIVAGGLLLRRRRMSA